MKPGTILHTIALTLSSVSSLFSASAPVQAPATKVKLSKKSSRLTEDILLKVDPIAYTPPTMDAVTKLEKGQHYPWKNNIVTTIFWIGEEASGNNPVPNHSSSWDKHWAQNYGGFDNPNRA